MRFAGKVWRLLVGIKDGLSLIFLLLFFTALFAALSFRPNPGAVREGALLLELDGTVVEETSPIDPLNALLSSAAPVREYAARDLIRAIDKAAADDRVKGLALDLSLFLGGGQVHMAELGAALDRFHTTGKPILAYAVAYTDDSLQLAAHADEIWVDPLGGAALTGPGGERLYYADLLDRLNVTMNVFRVGTYKSAVEPYLLNEMSPAARENAEALYGSLWQEWQAHVKQARPQADIAQATQNIPAWLAASNGDLAQASIAAGLADKIGTRVEWGDRMAELVGEDRWNERPGGFATTELDPWLADIGPVDRKDGSVGGLAGGVPKIGVITVAGEISDGDAGPGQAGAERIVSLLDDALDDGLSALVIRVDSPGGTVTGSEAIRRAVLRHKAKGIPVAVSMGNVAASGGYWISTSGQRIFAEPETMTGSIGIFAVLPTFQDALAEWGVTTDGVRTTPLSGQPDIAAGLTPETQTVLQATIESGYRRFLSLVADSRGISRERADELAQGQVWDGGSARQLGLVDEFGGLDSALEWAAAQAKLEDGAWQPVYLGAGQSNYPAFLRHLMPGNAEQRQSSDMFALMARRQDNLMATMMADLRGLMTVRGAQARCLECPAPAGGKAGEAPGTAANPLSSWLVRRLFD